MSFDKPLLPLRMVLIGAVLAAPAALPAQDRLEDFTLPAATPTPTPAPQGPVDERVGVPIAPRTIPERTTPERASPEPAAAAPTATPTPTPPPAVTSSAAPAGTAPARTAPAPSDSRPNAPVVRNEGATGASTSIETPSGPGFETFDDELPNDAVPNADGWYDVGEGAEAGADANEAANAQSPAPSQTGSAPPSLLDNITAQPSWLAATAGLMLAILLMLVWTIIRRRREMSADAEEPAMALTAGVRRSMGEDAPPETEREPEAESKPEQQGLRKEPVSPADTETLEVPLEAAVPEESAVEPPPSPTHTSPAHTSPAHSSPAPPTPIDPAQLDFELKIVSASRSLMQFSIEFSLEIFNRSDTALRDLKIAASLNCAQKGAGNTVPLARSQVIDTVDRIGQHQSRRVAGTVKMPVQEIKPIAQSGKPVMIPLVHVTLEAAGQNAIERSFVVGTPSATSTMRVHPLLLEGPPGGLPPLRAQLIKHPAPEPTRATQV